VENSILRRGRKEEEARGKVEEGGKNI